MNFPNLQQTNMVIPRVDHTSRTGHHACLASPFKLKVNVWKTFKSIIVNV